MVHDDDEFYKSQEEYQSNSHLLDLSFDKDMTEKCHNHKETARSIAEVQSVREMISAMTSSAEKKEYFEAKEIS